MPIQGKRLYADGVNSSVMKKIAKFWFKEENFIALKNDPKRFEFVIVVSDTVNQSEIDIFQEYWGRGGGLRVARAEM